ncbi:MAG TPA: 3-deoxy-7-phosphoheptulonate synthase [Acidimicrobiia bacterium]|nr:3-deoxy-7-phosphoheptulonate synthase [Acidimicrobiia bacterium]
MSNQPTPPPKSEPILKSHRRPDDVSTTIVRVGNVVFGDGSYPVIAGPVAVESDEQIAGIAVGVAEAGASVLRGGTFRAENSPYSFRGLGREGLWFLESAGHEAGLPVLTEVIEHSHVGEAAHHADMLEVGPDNMQNFSLLRDVGKAGRPVLLHRGPSATIDEWLMAAEYILAEGNQQVVLCERGSRTFDPRTSDTLDISAVPVVQRMSHLPVVIDPAPASGGEDLIGPLALAGRSVGADGLSVLVHTDPPRSKAGNGSQLDLGSFHRLMDRLGIPTLRDEIDRIDRELVKLLARRQHSSIEIAKIKAHRGLPMRSPEREVELIDEARRDAANLGIDPDYISELMTLVLDHSRDKQRKALGDDA